MIFNSKKLKDLNKVAISNEKAAKIKGGSDVVSNETDWIITEDTIVN